MALCGHQREETLTHFIKECCGQAHVRERCGVGDEETVEKILLFGNPDQEEVQKKKFVELWRERSKKIELVECCTTGREVEITRLRSNTVPKALLGKSTVTVTLSLARLGI